MKRFFSAKHYISVLRRQPVHVQHVSAAIFAGAITACIAIIILYFDYGFWHERYSRTEAVVTEESNDSNESVITVQSPGEMIGGFFKEAAQKLQEIKTSSSTILDGKEVYRREP